MFTSTGKAPVKIKNIKKCYSRGALKLSNCYQHVMMFSLITTAKVCI